MPTAHRLVLIRHAEAESAAASDAERRLTPTGRADAAELGRWLREQDIVADEAWVSSATRTRETWDQLATSAGWSVTPHVDGLLYGTDEEGVLEIVRGTDESVRTVVVVGHNPTMEMLVHLLDDGEGSAPGEPVLSGVPTATAAVFDLASPWAETGPMTGRIAQFHVARS